MTKTAHTRSFSLADAQAGAPVTRRDGIAARFLAYVPDAERYEQVLYLAKAGGRSIHSTSAEGRAAHSVELGADLVMAPLGFIDNKPVFTGDKVMINGGVVTAGTAWRNFNCATWPVPERVYPETAMTAEELDRAFIGPQGLRKVANAALRHAVYHGQLPTKEAYDQCVAQLAEAEAMLRMAGYQYKGYGEWQAPVCTAAPAPSQPAGAAKGRDGFSYAIPNSGDVHVKGSDKACNYVMRLLDKSFNGDTSKRELAIAEAVRNAAVPKLAHHLGQHVGAIAILNKLDLPAIIASVKETA